MEDIVVGVIDAVNSNSFSGNYSNEIFNCKNSSMDIIEGNYSITYDKDLGTQLFLEDLSKRFICSRRFSLGVLTVVIYKEQILHRVVKAILMAWWKYWFLPSKKI